MSQLCWISGLPWRGAIMGVVCGFLAWFLATRVELIRGVEEWMLDGCFSFRGERPTRANIVLIGLDDESLDELQEPMLYISPKLKEVIEYLKSEARVKAIGLDIILPDSFQNEPELQPGGRGDPESLGLAILAHEVVLAKCRVGQRWIHPLPAWLIAPARTDVGFTNVTDDPDNFLRRQQLIMKDSRDKRPSVHFALALHRAGKQEEIEWDGLKLSVGGRAIPIDEHHRLRINFLGPPGTIREIPFRDVLAAARQVRPLGEDLRDATVIIGVTARSQQDFHATPYANKYWPNYFARESGLTSGPEIHANLLATLADEAYLVPVSWVSSLAGLLFFGVLLGAGYERLGRARTATTFLVFAIGLFLVHHFGWKAICVLAFKHGNWRLEMMGMLLLGALGLGGSFLLRWISTRRMLQLLKSREILEAFEGGPSSLGLRGEERVISILFADIRGFSNYAKTHSPQDVVALLNAYYTAIVPVLEKHGGMLNQYAGDGIMVLFGAPEPNVQHALQAVRAAVGMVAIVHSMRDTWAAHDWPDMRIGVGVHTGPVIVGTVGSPRRLDYTAIGDVVNGAARIEAENKTVGTEILISAATFQAVPRGERELLGCDPQSLEMEMKGVGQMALHAVRVGQALEVA